MYDQNAYSVGDAAHAVEGLRALFALISESSSVVETHRLHVLIVVVLNLFYRHRFKRHLLTRINGLLESIVWLKRLYVEKRLIFLR